MSLFDGIGQQGLWCEFIDVQRQTFRSQQAHPYNMATMQGSGMASSADLAAMQAARLRNFVSLQSILALTPETKFGRAKRIAEEVQERRPEMQVKRLTRRD